MKVYKLNEATNEQLFTKYVIFFRYDRGEDYAVYYVGDSLVDSKREFKKQVCKWFSIGPDDVSQLWFVKFKNLTQDLVDGLMSNDDKVSEKTIRYICNPENNGFDSWYNDRNNSKYFDKDICEADGPEGFDYLADLIEDGTIPVQSDDEEMDPYDYLYELDSEEIERLLQKYYKPVWNK